jgi:hypothetical protein
MNFCSLTRTTRIGTTAARLWLVLTLALAGPAWAGTLLVNGFEHAPAGRGGSNLHWFALGPNCDREPYGILVNYHLPGVRALVQDQLLQLRARGQDRIATGVIHLRAPEPNNGAWTGTLLDSTGGDLRPQYRSNLATFLYDIRSSGFVELLFRYFPQGPNDPSGWSTFSESLYQENWNLIVNLEPILEGSGLAYKTDLGVELMPRARIIDVFGYPVIEPEQPANAAHSEYARRLWREYVSVFDAGRSVGFSFVSDSNTGRTEARVRHMPTIYTGANTAGVYPSVLALDLYGANGVDEATQFRRHDQHMRGLAGLADTPWIVAEAYYNDAAAASGVLQGMADTGRRVHYLTQWPLQRGSLCGAGVTEATPELFEQYQRRGF